MLLLWVIFEMFVFPISISKRWLIDRQLASLSSINITVIKFNDVSIIAQSAWSTSTMGKTAFAEIVPITAA